MGSTVFKQAEVFSFPTESGRVGYVWAEETYDKKDGPQQANWCVMAIGHSEHMVERIFGLARSIPGGMLKVKNVSSRAFISAMMAHVAYPKNLPSTVVQMKNSRNGFSDAVNDGNRARVQALLERHGKAAEARCVVASVQDGGSNFSLDLSRDLAVVIDLLKRDANGNGMTIPWRIFNGKPRSDMPGVSDFQPQKPVTPIDIQMMQTGVNDGYSRDSMYLCLVDGTPFSMGSRWMIETHLIELAAKRETDSPGFYLGALKGFTAACDNVQPAPQDTVFRVDASQIDNEWQRSNVKAVCKSVTGQEGLSFELTLLQAQEAFSGMPDAGPAQYHLARVLENSQLTQVLLDQPEPELMFERQRG